MILAPLRIFFFMQNQFGESVSLPESMSQLLFAVTLNTAFKTFESQTDIPGTGKKENFEHSALDGF